MVDIAESLMHWRASRSVRKIANSLGVARNTLARCLAPAIAEGITPCDDPLSATEWAEWIHLWLPALRDIKLRRTAWPLIEYHRDPTGPKSDPDSLNQRFPGGRSPLTETCDFTTSPWGERVVGSAWGRRDAEGIEKTLPRLKAVLERGQRNPWRLQ
ncbi:hypothetical protein [Nonomuraea endophytica]|uniref:Uncharacterized protein n=1 Tax=Nonomuraea endophytica TaxID=714136 RepID=A0A7W8AFA8_9ACTN|nr:hypothetical protein [Nonomuraea endophytica]MBB5085261.1 hypothetical protein [Nonomuraea endophytica]